MALMKQGLGIVERDKENESISEELPEEVVLTLSEARCCLHTIGKSTDGITYVYLAINLCHRNLMNVDVLTQFKHIVFVDVSANRLTSEHFKIFSLMKQLLMLNADDNLLASIDTVVMPNLQVLSLNKNQLISADPNQFKELQCLNMNYNRIQAVTWAPFYKLKRVELRGNELTTTNILFSLTLTHLYLAENKIKYLEVPPCLENLEVLHARNNKIESLNKLSLSKLTYLNLRNNNISSISELKKLTNLKALQTLILLGNPAFKRKSYGELAYVDTILIILPQLERIDKIKITERNKKSALSAAQWVDVAKLDNKSFSMNNSYY